MHYSMMVPQEVLDEDSKGLKDKEAAALKATSLEVLKVSKLCVQHNAKH